MGTASGGTSASWMSMHSRNPPLSGPITTDHSMTVRFASRIQLALNLLPKLSVTYSAAPLVKDRRGLTR